MIYNVQVEAKRLECKRPKAIIIITLTAGTFKKKMMNVFFALNTLPKEVALDIVIMGCWNLWMQRNGHIFDGIRPAAPSQKGASSDELSY